jgi:hypothetical protein
LVGVQGLFPKESALLVAAHGAGQTTMICRLGEKPFSFNVVVGDRRVELKSGE